MRPLVESGPPRASGCDRTRRTWTMRACGRARLDRLQAKTPHSRRESDQKRREEDDERNRRPGGRNSQKGRRRRRPARRGRWRSDSGDLERRAAIRPPVRPRGRERVDRGLAAARRDAGPAARVPLRRALPILGRGGDDGCGAVGRHRQDEEEPEDPAANRRRHHASWCYHVPCQVGERNKTPALATNDGGAHTAGIPGGAGTPAPRPRRSRRQWGAGQRRGRRRALQHPALEPRSRPARLHGAPFQPSACLK